MTGDLSDDDDRMPMGGEEGGPAMDDEDDDVEMELDPRSGHGDTHPRGNARGQSHAGAGTRQRRPQATTFDDDENF